MRYAISRKSDAISTNYPRIEGAAFTPQPAGARPKRPGFAAGRAMQSRAYRRAACGRTSSLRGLGFPRHLAAQARRFTLHARVRQTRPSLPRDRALGFPKRPSLRGFSSLRNGDVPSLSPRGDLESIQLRAQ
jgi:hypothetical protein